MTAASPNSDRRTTLVQAIGRVVDCALRKVEDLDGRVSALVEVITDLAGKLFPPPPPSLPLRRRC